jgi:hypothetical protein
MGMLTRNNKLTSNNKGVQKHNEHIRMLGEHELFSPWAIGGNQKVEGVGHNVKGHWLAHRGWKYFIFSSN